MMTPSEKAQLREEAMAATARPWNLVGGNVFHPEELRDPFGLNSCGDESEQLRVVASCDDEGYGGITNQRDATFILHACNSVIELLDENERLERIEAAARALHDSFGTLYILGPSDGTLVFSPEVSLGVRMRLRDLEAALKGEAKK